MAPDSQESGAFLWVRPVGRTLLEGEQAQICEARGRSVQKILLNPLELLAYPHGPLRGAVMTGAQSSSFGTS